MRQFQYHSGDPAAERRMKLLPDHHLDLGCGKFPRNPYQRGQLSGIDIRPMPAGIDFDYAVANLVLQPIPYADNSFGSVSAYDFIEHVPRILVTPGGQDTMFPFVRLMQEVWRVLAPGGVLYALTPAFPHPEAFADPTHVNIITDRTHTYFCGDAPMARMYGFEGRFQCLRVEWVHIADAYSPIVGAPENRKQHTGLKRIARSVRRWSRRLRGVESPDQRKIYLLWELQAIKDAPP
jgi:SAM-dependent methyltransferase